LAALCTGAVTACTPAWGADVLVPLTAGTARVEQRVASLREQRDAGVVKQRYDYSCGSAALATLLSYGLNDRVDESELLRDLLEPLSLEQLDALKQTGLSLSALQRLAQARGHKAQGFRLHQAQLAKLERPVIVFIKPAGYEHFAVFRGQRGDRVYLADPSLGNVRMPLYRFLEMWADASGRGVALVVERATGEWPSQYALQLASAIDPPLQTSSAMSLLNVAAPRPLNVPNR